MNKLLFYFILCINCQLLEAQVTVYTEMDYTGTATSYTEGSYYLSDDVRSLKVDSGYVVLMGKNSTCADICYYGKNIIGFLHYTERRTNKRVGTLLGRKGCSITINRINVSSSTLKVEITTGNDDLRGGSRADIHIISGYDNTIVHNLVKGEGFPANTKRTFDIPVTRFALSELLRIELRYYSGRTDVFQTQDNWDVKEFKVSFLNESYIIPVVLVNSQGIRFTGNYPIENIRIPRGLSSYYCKR